MKILFYTDLQATEGADRCRADPSCPLQRFRVRKFYNELHRIYGEEKCDRYCDLGDTTDDRAFIYRATLDVVVEGLTKMLQHRMDGFIKLTGNHEQLLKDGQISAEGMFRPYFRHVGSGHVNVAGCWFVYRSYTDKYDELNAELKKTAALFRKSNPGEKLILLAHGDVYGAKYASGEMCEDGISLDTIELFDTAFFGHVHNHQTLIEGKAWFIGSPFQQDFGEASQQKFVAVLDFSSTKVTVKFIPLTGFPEYRTVNLKDFLQLANPQEEHRYKVVLDSIEETEQFYSNPLSELGEARLTHTEKSPDKSEAEILEITEDPRKLLERYVKSRPLVGLPEELNPGEIVDLAMTFIGED